jgi:hydrogenase maturation protein HypF
MRRRLILRITGIVQGVGFRPFLYNLVRSRGLDGFVLNDDQGVLLEIEGEPRALDGIEDAIRAEAPPLSRIAAIRTTQLPAAGHKGFVIRESPQARKRRVPVSPDAATCDACTREIFDERDRRYRYPFTNCTHCGPRLTIVQDVPYDRSRTTMSGFILCEACRREYEDPANRRFHAQPNACPECGPRLSLEDATGIKLPVRDPLSEARRLLGNGHILAIKGIGGFHLSCDAENEVAVHTLRERKVREEKPFALMAADPEEIGRHCYLEPEEAALLTSAERPIVLLRRRPECVLPEGIAPRQNYLGFMLPYAPLHHLLFRPAPGEGSCPGVLVMTSGNRSDEPIVYQEAEGRERLQDIADYFLLHDRPIHLRCDDSVARLFRGRPQILRRARGYVPRVVPLFPALPEPVLAVGGMLKNTFALGREGEALQSHHIGDLENLETYRSLREGIVHFCRLFDHDPQVVVHDLHPDYLSTRYALEFPARARIGIQHHEAHIAAVLSENQHEGPAVGVAFDGTGYGHDGTLWGGEFFVFRDGGFERAGSLDPILLPGGEAAIREPWRVAYALLARVEPESDPYLRLGGPTGQVPRQAADLVGRMIERRLNCPWTSGAGRYFDAVGALLLRRSRNLFEGQVPMELEMLAGRAGETAIGPPWPVRFFDTAGRPRSGLPAWPIRFRVSLDDAVRALLDEMRSGVAEAKLARRFHLTMADAVVRGAERLAREEGTRTVALGGGVFQNQLLLGMVVDGLVEQGLEPILPRDVPANDGGISYGQLAAAAWELRRGA